MFTRRSFLGLSTLAAIDTTRSAEPSTGKSFTFGFITDVHHGTHGKDQQARIRAFVDAAIARNPDFIIQCGDFCCAKGGLDSCRGFLAEWNRFPGPKHHVIGNHDCDFQSKEELLKAWGIPNRYYSFDACPIHFVVLDRNHFIGEDGKTVAYYEATRPPFTFITIDPAKNELVIEAAESAYENQAAMKPELVWVDPPRLAARRIPLGG
jgi:hypothetical protein